MNWLRIHLSIQTEQNRVNIFFIVKINTSSSDSKQKLQEFMSKYSWKSCSFFNFVEETKKMLFIWNKTFANSISIKSVLNSLKTTLFNSTNVNFNSFRFFLSNYKIYCLSVCKKKWNIYLLFHFHSIVNFVLFERKEARKLSDQNVLKQRISAEQESMHRTKVKKRENSLSLVDAKFNLNKKRTFRCWKS